MKMKIISIIALISLLSIPAIVLAADDTVTINVNVSASAVIEVVPDTATFNLVTPGTEGHPDEVAFTITNVGSVNFTNIYVTMNVPTTETSNPLGTGNPASFYAGGFVVLKNESASDTDLRFVGRQEWNLTDKPADYTKPDSETNTWGYFGNESRQYFWDMKNGSSETTNGCNDTGATIRIKNWAVNGSSAAYNLGAEATTYTLDTATTWGIFDAESTGPLAGYCVAANYDCTKIFIYQWDQTSPFSQCADERYLYYDATSKFKPNDQFGFNITVWVPKGVPAGSTSSSTLTVTAS